MDRAPASRPGDAGSTPAPRSHLVRDLAEVISLLEHRGFLEATAKRVAELPDDEQGSLFDPLEEVA